MIKLLQKLKLYTKLGRETVWKYSYQNIFVIICRLPAILTTRISHWTTASSVKSISGVEPNATFQLHYLANFKKR